MEDAKSKPSAKKCSNCLELIEISKFMLHEAYCLRHMYRCECGEVVCKTEKEEHEEEKHANVTCKHCSFQALKHEFGDHEENCDKKPKECQFCEQTILYDDYYGHINFCGSKTRTCEFCRRNVMMRNQRYHEEEECARFIREEYERERQEKIKVLEEEEKRADKVKEMQKARRKIKEDKEKADKAKKANRPKPKPANRSKPTDSSRIMPDYFSKPKTDNPARVRKNAASTQPTNEDNAPKLRNRDKKPIEKAREEAKQGLAQRSKKSAVSSNCSSKIPGDFDEIPPELLNQIYSEDLDHNDGESMRQHEVTAPRGGTQTMKIPHKSMDNQPQQLLGSGASEGMNDFGLRNRRSRLQRPPHERDQNSAGGADQNEDELLQRAIVESLKEGGFGMSHMSGDLDSTPNDPEMLEAIQRSMQER